MTHNPSPNRWILIRPSDGALIDACYTPSNDRWTFQGPGDLDVKATLKLIKSTVAAK